MVEILSLLPKDQFDIVLGQPHCEIEPVFMGFMEQYYHLSQIIPKHFTVIDLGCCYNPQCFYFTEHKEYIAVDVSDCIKFKSPNCRLFTMTINRFINECLGEFNLKETFAICSYVPPWHGHQMAQVGAIFPNSFTYYPHGGYDM